MLRFSYCRSDDGDQWRLSGQLAGPWVDELGMVWRRIREHSPRALALIDLRDVTFIDEAGEQLLSEMKSAGAKFVGAGIEHQHLLDNLHGGDAGAIRRRLEHLEGGRR